MPSRTQQPHLRDLVMAHFKRKKPRAWVIPKTGQYTCRCCSTRFPAHCNSDKVKSVGDRRQLDAAAQELKEQAREKLE